MEHNGAAKLDATRLRRTSRDGIRHDSIERRHVALLDTIERFDKTKRDEAAGLYYTRLDRIERLYGT